jgi:hypothetical protein
MEFPIVEVYLLMSLLKALGRRKVVFEMVEQWAGQAERRGP